MVRLGAYLILMFCISFGLYMFGNTSIANAFAVQYGAQGSSLMVGTSSNALLAPQEGGGVVDKIVITVLATVGVSGILAATAVLFTGFGAIYIVPLLIIVAILNLFVFPFSFLVTGAMPDFIALPLTLFLNLLLVLSVVSFVRGVV